MRIICFNHITNTSIPFLPVTDEEDEMTTK